MAQINLTINQEEILSLLGENQGEGFRRLLEEALNQIMLKESAEQLGAERYERTEGRSDSRNGYRDRELTTRVGRLTLHVPRHRQEPFRTMIFENYSRSEAALIASMAEMVVSGVSSRKVSGIVETLCGKSISKSAVSDLCKDLSAAVKTFRERPLTENYPFLVVDATYFKVRENHRIISKALMIAVGTSGQGKREIVGFGLYDQESKSTWNDFLSGLRKRGLSGILMIVSDAHEGIRDAVSKVFPEASWQRCQFHFSRNIADKAPKKYQAAIRAELNEMFNCRTVEEARKIRDRMLEEYHEVAESAMTCLDEGFESSMTAMLLPAYLQRYYRTSNHIERLNKELKRRSKVIGVFPNAESLLRLMGSVLIEQNEILTSRKAVFTPERLELLCTPDVREKLLEMAHEQRKLLAA